MKFSVIVPLYNKEEYIERTLRSVLSQTYGDYQLMVVDDGSSDGSYSKAIQIVDGHPHCNVISQQNAGVAVARNRGVELSEGEYVCFLDSDDWWEPTFLAEMERLIDACPEAAMLGTGFYLIKNGVKKVAPIGVERDFEMGYINYCRTYAQTLCMPISSSSVAIRRDAFSASGGFRKGIELGEDFDLWIRLALRYKVALLNRPLSNYNQDLPLNKRATRKLREPQKHMLWNLDYLAEEETHNADLKLLLDRLRASGLYRFYLSRQYHNAALMQLEKIDWSHVPESTYKIYHSPLWWQRMRFGLRTLGAKVKGSMLRSRMNHRREGNAI